MKKFVMMGAVCALSLLVLPVFLYAGGGGQSAGSAGISNSYRPTGGPSDYANPTNVSARVIRPQFWIVSDHNTATTGSGIAWQAIRKYTNIDFQVVPVPLAGYDERLATTLASRTLPDVMGLRSFATADRYGPEGAFLSFEPYISAGIMPNFVRVMNSIPPAMSLSFSPNGVRYGAPRFYETPRMDRALLARIDVLQKLGLSQIPETLDDYTNMLRTVKRNYPNSAPYINRWGASNLLSGFQLIFNTSFTYFVDQDVNRIVYGPLTQNFRDMLAYVTQLYAEGLIARDFAIMSDQEYEQALVTGRGMFTYCYQDTNFYEASRSLMDPDWWWGAVLPPKYNGKRYGYPNLHGYFGYYKVISNTSQFKEELIRFMDWTYARSGANALMFGIEGETYNWGPGGQVNMLADIRFQGNMAGSITGHNLNDQFLFSILTAEGSEFFENTDRFTIAQKKFLNDNNAWAPVSPSARFTDTNAQQRYNAIKTAADTYVLEAVMQIILGQTSINDWDRVVQALRTTFNVEEGLNIINTAYRETLSR